MKAKPVIGRREYVAFPDWGIRGVEAKIDTGARTSAIHVDNIKRLSGERVRFEVVLLRGGNRLPGEDSVAWMEDIPATGATNEQVKTAKPCPHLFFFVSLADDIKLRLRHSQDLTRAQQMVSDC